MSGVITRIDSYGDNKVNPWVSQKPIHGASYPDNGPVAVDGFVRGETHIKFARGEVRCPGLKGYGLSPGLIGKRKGNRPVFLFVFLSLKFLSFENVGKSDLSPGDAYPHTYHQLSNQRFFVHTVTVPERIAVKGNIPQHKLAVGTRKSMNSKSAVTQEESGILFINWRIGVGSRSNQIRTEIVWQVPPKANLCSDMGDYQCNPDPRAYIRNYIVIQSANTV